MNCPVDYPAVAEDGDYVELVDEDDEHGPVRLCRKDGTVLVVMSRKAFDFFRPKGPQS